MKAYFLAYGNDRLLCESEPSSDPDEKRRIIGAFLPGKEGNYYRQVLVGFTGPGERQFTPSFAEWWEWLRGSIAAGDTLMDEEFPFEPEDVRVVHAELDLSQ